MPATTMKTSADMSSRPCSSTISAYTGNATQPSFWSFSSDHLGQLRHRGGAGQALQREEEPGVDVLEVSHASAMPAMLPAAAMSLWPRRPTAQLRAGRTRSRAGRNS